MHACAKLCYWETSMCDAVYKMSGSAFCVCLKSHTSNMKHNIIFGTNPAGESFV